MLLATALPPASSAGAAAALAPAGGEEGDAAATSCLYPSAHQRFGVTVGGNISQFDVAAFPAGSYMDWSVHQDPTHPNSMIYYPVVLRNRSNGSWPTGADLTTAVQNTPGATWMIGSEAETVWMDNVTPEEYARAYHDVTTAIKALDPTAKFAFTSVATVSTLRLAWLDKALAAYRSLYGVDPQVDMWTVHTYVVNEMAREWGSELPTGIPNVVGYHTEADWAEATVAGASGGTVQQSRTPGAKAYFAFQGSQATLYLRTGPDAGRAAVYIDERADPVETVDLYAVAPGGFARTFTNLTPAADVRGNRHNVRVEVTGAKNPASSNTWVRVDALAAPSTVDMPGGRLENNDPMRARIVISVDNHDNIAMIADQIRAFRQWMANNGQRHKPLVNSEYGILMTEDLGFDYQRVRTFMLNSFNLFVNDLQDPQLGLPEDDNRMLQEWLWFALNQDTFEGRVVHTGLYSDATKEIKPLGQEFANYVRPLVQSYVDLETTAFALTPIWALFQGDQTAVQVEAEIVNRGIAASGPFTVQMIEGASVQGSWPVGGLAKRFDAGDRVTIAGAWQTVVSGNRTVTLTADNPQQTADNCRANNVRSATLEVLPFTDLAVANVRTNPRLLSPAPGGGTMTPAIQADVLNLGSQGTQASQIRVQFWDADVDPASPTALLKTFVLEPGLAPGLLTLTYEWPNLSPGIYNVAVTVDGAPEDANLGNNRQTLRFMVPAANVYLPHYLSRYRAPRALPADLTPLQTGKAISGAWFPPQ
jgi:hypothetical protein